MSGNKETFKAPSNVSAPGRAISIFTGFVCKNITKPV
jgi:hypothetical protein